MQLIIVTIRRVVVDMGVTVLGELTVVHTIDRWYVRLLSDAKIIDDCCPLNVIELLQCSSHTNHPNKQFRNFSVRIITTSDDHMDIIAHRASINIILVVLV